MAARRAGLSKSTSFRKVLEVVESSSRSLQRCVLECADTVPASNVLQ